MIIFLISNKTLSRAVSVRFFILLKTHLFSIHALVLEEFIQITTPTVFRTNQ